MDLENEKQTLISKIKKQVEALLAAESISEIEKEKLIRQALNLLHFETN